jgi:hypothetical protein
VLKVDTKDERITYPDGLTVNGDFTCNFSGSENFVVLECVHRLLDKGYKPEHIELEPKWKLGHGASGGRADILITDNQKNHCIFSAQAVIAAATAKKQAIMQRYL